mmetsp:Transcript_69748/g.114230  ORF Transcript_69748/g.114230 Transcript_69748/m.114230 type:complete len:244 (+) Transcript_69748:688-1419(+)
MRIRVEEAILTKCQQIGLRQVFRQQGSIKVLCFQCLEIRDFGTFHKGQSQDFRGGELIYHFGTCGPLQVLKVVVPALRVFRFGSVVDLSIQNHLGIFEHVHPNTRRPFNANLELVQGNGDLIELCQVQVIHFLQVVALDLNGHLYAILGLGAMDLSQRRRGQRLVIELSEEFAGRFSQLRLNDLLGTFSTECGNFILQSLQLIDVLLRHQIFSAGQNLTQLHIGGSQSHKLCHSAFARLGVHG